MNISNYFILGNERVKGNCLKAIESLPLGMYEVRIAKVEKKRTSQQNKFFHGPILETFCDYTGDRKDELKKKLKARFLKTIESEVEGVKLIELPETSKLTVDEMNVFLDKILATAMVLGITLPSREYHGVS